MKKKKRYLYSYMDRVSGKSAIQILDKKVTDMMRITRHPFCKYIINTADVQKTGLFSTKKLLPRLEMELEELNELAMEVIQQTISSLELIK